ncbi:MAG: hypothetical protein IKW85_12140 [Muribaculaceae bacterium]|nr:hypothetical protein [Muribaculaceae bacterium]
MKKYLLLTAAALLALPALNSCGKPSGDAEDDANTFQSLYEKENELTLETLEKTVEIAEYYAENEDLDAWNDLDEEFKDLISDIYEDKYEDKIDDLQDKIKDAVDDMKDKKKDKDDDDDDE